MPDQVYGNHKVPIQPLRPPSKEETATRHAALNGLPVLPPAPFIESPFDGKPLDASLLNDVVNHSSDADLPMFISKMMENYQTGKPNPATRGLIQAKP